MEHWVGGTKFVLIECHLKAQLRVLTLWWCCNISILYCILINHILCLKKQVTPDETVVDFNLTLILRNTTTDTRKSYL